MFDYLAFSIASPTVYRILCSVLSCFQMLSVSTHSFSVLRTHTKLSASHIDSEVQSAIQTLSADTLCHNRTLSSIPTWRFSPSCQYIPLSTNSTHSFSVLRTHTKLGIESSSCLAHSSGPLHTQQLTVVRLVFKWKLKSYFLNWLLISNFFSDSRNMLYCAVH